MLVKEKPSRKFATTRLLLFFYLQKSKVKSQMQLYWLQLGAMNNERHHSVKADA